MKPTTGRIVLYVLRADFASGGIREVVRPAMVVNVNDDETIDLQVFTNGSEDDDVLHESEATGRNGGRSARCVVHRRKVQMAECAPSADLARISTRGTWFWPTRVP